MMRRHYGAGAHVIWVGGQDVAIVLLFIYLLFEYPLCTSLCARHQETGRIQKASATVDPGNSNKNTITQLITQLGLC